MSGRTRPLVIKLGGTTIAEEQGVLGELAIHARERDIVLVHGGGKRLTEWLDRLGVEHRFHDGLRVTDDAALEVALAVLRGVVNAELVAALRSLGVDAVGLSGLDGGLLVGARVPQLGRVVSVSGVRGAIIEALFLGGFVPVVAPVAPDPHGVICNVNADAAAAGLAAGLGADLVLLTDTDGVRGADGDRVATLVARDAEGLIDAGIVSGGMIPKVRAAMTALVNPDAVAVIADGRAPDALTRALTDDTFGTRIRLAAAAAP
ncbi:MAG: acetylglutamate kinase [Chloroflexi bacterium]|nr:acetylglutamate kinase [Chloroflexota bacterium]